MTDTVVNNCSSCGKHKVLVLGQVQVSRKVGPADSA